ncbi:hypothetical protein M885DRAFT_437011 [Pelagophyceae sp. CCMP2097]|nr:hypothetical protein M885DRAFT_437011 [Pelagophyceae sp. CCMP2097]
MGTLDSYAKSLESSMRSMYQLTSRKVFSVPKLALVPRVLALHPIAAAAATPLFLVVDALKARLVAKISAEIEVRRKLATALESRRSKVEAHDSSKAQAITAVGAQEWNSRQWAALAAEVEAHQHVKTLLETIRRYVRWLYWSDFLTPAIEVALSAMLEHRLIEPDDLWVTARAFEDALDMALTRSRAESELAELKSDVERIDELNAALADVRKRETPRQCRVASDSDDVLRLFNVAYARGTTRVAAADVAAKRGDVLAVTGPNGCGKSTLFALLDACAHKRRLPRSLEFLEKENCAEGFASECAAESESFVQVPDGSVAHIAQRPYCPVDARPIDWIRYQPHLSDGAGEAAEALIISKLFSLLEFDSRQGTGDLKSAAGTNATLFEKHDDYCSTLSGGQQVKLEIVRQLLLPEKRGGKCAAVVLLDEIFSPLDPRSKAIVQRAIKVACPDSVVMAIYHADAGECVPGGDFFTGTLHFQPVPKGGVQITHKPTCA